MLEKKLFKIDVFRQIKGNYSLLPIIVLTPIAFGMAAFSMMRTSVKSPDVIINRVSNPKPWEHMKHDESYRLVQINKVNYDDCYVDPDRPKI